MPATYYPMGLSISIALNEIDEPVVSMLFQVPDDEDVIEMVFDMQEIGAALGLSQEGMIRGNVLREMLTMFPDDKDKILANVMFRWTGMIDGS